MKQLNPLRMRTIYAVATSVLTLGVLIFSLLCLKDVQSGQAISRVWFGLVFLFLSLSRIPLVFRSKVVDKSLLGFIKNLAFLGIYFALAIIVFIISPQSSFCCFICSAYFFTILANRILACFEKRKLSVYLFNGFLGFLALLLAVFPLILLGDDAAAVQTMLLCLLMIMLVALVETIAFVLSSMKLKGILKIMRRTYAFEVFYGLFVLIIASSFYFSIMEENIPTFWDGLWYSFAVVTTIGFGDFTVTSSLSRILSVLLGIYGLIVVAVLTSIIVNFYNETKDRKDSEEELPPQE